MGPGTVRTRRPPGIQLLLVAAAFLSYMAIRAIAVGDRDDALQHAQSILHLERFTGLDLERGAQALLAAPGFGREFFTAVYVWAYWPVLIGALIFTRVRHPDRYRVLR